MRREDGSGVVVGQFVYRGDEMVEEQDVGRDVTIGGKGRCF